MYMTFIKPGDKNQSSIVELNSDKNNLNNKE
jgi:hypothetical protein